MEKYKNISSTELLQKQKELVSHKNLKNQCIYLAGVFFLFWALLILFLLFTNLFFEGFDRLGWNFLTSFPSRFPEKAGVASAFVGSLVVMLVTALTAIPLGVAAALYLELYAPKNFYTRLIEINIVNLAGVPSIVFGLLALGLFVYKFGFGSSVLTGGLTLGLLILPIIIVATREAVRTIPKTLFEASYAMGATKRQTIVKHVLPYSSGGIATGIIIALSRAIGETAPLITIGALTFIAFLPSSPVTAEFPYLSLNWLSDAFTVLPIQMFNWVSRPQPEFQKNAAAAGVLLLLMTLLLNASAIYLRQRYRKKYQW
jgi:phosphate transport system permease protein